MAVVAFLLSNSRLSPGWPTIIHATGDIHLHSVQA